MGVSQIEESILAIDPILPESNLKFPESLVKRRIEQPALAPIENHIDDSQLFSRETWS